MAKRQKAKSIKTLIKNYGIMWRRDSVFWDSPRGQTKKKTPQKRGRYSCSALCMDNPWGDRGGTWGPSSRLNPYLVGQCPGSIPLLPRPRPAAKHRDAFTAFGHRDETAWCDDISEF